MNSIKKIIFLSLLLIQVIFIGHANSKDYYENLITLAMKEMDNQNYAKSLEYLITITDYAKENKQHDMHVRALNRMGTVYMNILSYEKAIECYLEAYQITAKLQDKAREMSILNNIAQLYFLSNDLDKSVEHLDKAYKIAVETRDSFTMALLYNLAIISNKREHLEKTEEYLNLAMERINQFPEDPDILYVKGAKAEYLYLKKEYNSAEQLTLEVLNQNNGLYPDLEADCLFLLSKIYNKKGNYPQAVFYAKEALMGDVNLSMTIEIYDHLSTVYRETNFPSLALQYQDSVMRLKDSLLQRNSASQVLRGQIQFDLNNLEKTIAENKAKQKRNQLISSFVVIFIIALFLLIIYVRSIKSKQLKEQQRISLLELKMSENEIERKNKQLISNTLFQLSKNELMEEIIQTLSDIPNQVAIPELHPIIQKLKSQIKDPANADWNSFTTYFEQSNPAFLATLTTKHPNLNTKDIRLSSYIHLNLDSKEISKLLHITPDHCKKRKRLLAQKLGVPTTEIYSYLAGIV